MAVSVATSIPEGRDPAADAVFRNQAASRKRVDPKDEYKTVAVDVDSGLKDAGGKAIKASVTVRYPLDGWYVFACFSDNEKLHKVDRDVWDALARNALELFAALKGKMVKDGPRQEAHNRYNFFVELNSAIEYRESTVAHFQAKAAEAARLAEIEELRAKLGVR